MMFTNVFATFIAVCLGITAAALAAAFLLSLAGGALEGLHNLTGLFQRHDAFDGGDGAGGEYPRKRA